MDIKLGNVEVNIESIESIIRVSHHIARIDLKIGGSIYVICGLSVPDNQCSYPGTYEELEALIDTLKS